MATPCSTPETSLLLRSFLILLGCSVCCHAVFEGKSFPTLLLHPTNHLAASSSSVQCQPQQPLIIAIVIIIIVITTTRVRIRIISVESAQAWMRMPLTFLQNHRRKLNRRQKGIEKLQRNRQREAIQMFSLL